MSVKSRGGVSVVVQRNNRGHSWVAVGVRSVIFMVVGELEQAVTAPLYRLNSVSPTHSRGLMIPPGNLTAFDPPHNLLPEFERAAVLRLFRGGIVRGRIALRNKGCVSRWQSYGATVHETDRFAATAF